MNRIVRKMMKENNQLSELLSPENQALETDIVVYLRGSRVSEYQQERVRRDILQIMLEGQTRGDSMADVLGDGKDFCDALLAELPSRTWLECAVNGLGSGGLYLGILAIIWAISALVQALVQNSWPYLPVSLGSLINFLFIPGAAGALVLYICRTSFSKSVQKKGLSSDKKAFLFFLAALLVCLLCGTLLRGVVLFSVPAVCAPVLIALLFGTYKLCDIWLDRFYTQQQQ
jgi:DNA-binding ferritin-like protein (Dps family)